MRPVPAVLHQPHSVCLTCVQMVGAGVDRAALARMDDTMAIIMINAHCIMQVSCKFRGATAPTSCVLGTVQDTVLSTLP